MEVFRFQIFRQFVQNARIDCEGKWLIIALEFMSSQCHENMKLTYIGKVGDATNVERFREQLKNVKQAEIS